MSRLLSPKDLAAIFEQINILSTETAITAWSILISQIDKTFPRGGYDKKSWKVACYWLMMRTFHCPNVVRIGSNAFIWLLFGRRGGYPPQSRAASEKEIKNRNVSANFFISKYFSFKSDFFTITPYFCNHISKMFGNFSLKLNMANRWHVFLALWPRKLRNTLNKW